MTDIHEKPLAGVYVTLRRQDQTLKLTKPSNKQGVVLFCDAKIGLYSVVAGPNLCGQVEVRNLFPILPETRKVKITYVNCHTYFPPRGCAIIARFSKGGEPLTGIKVDVARGTVRQQMVTDGFGRIILQEENGETIHIGFSDDRLESETRSVSCKNGRSTIEEEIVVEGQPRPD